MSQLDDLLAQAREADRAERINLRDPIAAVGESAIEPMADWLGDPELAAFAIRVLERIGREPTERSAVIAVLRAVDRTEIPPHLIGDLDRSLMALGGSTIQTRRERASRATAGDVERLLGGEGTADRGGELWTEAEYEYLFGRFPPDGPRPTDGEVELVAIELGRTPDAISWQWGDGAAYCGGGSASTASEPLKAWLDRRGLGG